MLRLKPEQDGAHHVWSNTRDGDRHLVLHVKLSGVSGAILARRTVPAFPWESSVVCKIAVSEHLDPGVICRSWMRLRSRIHLLQGITRAERRQAQGVPGLFHPPFRGYCLCRIEYGRNAIATDIADIALRPYIDVAFEAIL